MSFVDSLREAFERSGASQTEVATYVGVSSQAVNQWLSGKTAPSVEHLTKLAEFFHANMLDWVSPREAERIVQEQGGILTGPLLLADIGDRMRLTLEARQARKEDASEVLGVDEDKVALVLSGNIDCGVRGITRFCVRYAVPPNFILLGDKRSLDFGLLSAVEADQAETFRKLEASVRRGRNTGKDRFSGTR